MNGGERPMYCPLCQNDIQPAGFATGLQELVAFRIHIRKAHKLRYDTFKVNELRAAAENAGLKGKKIIYVDVDRNERYLA